MLDLTGTTVEEISQKIDNSYQLLVKGLMSSPSVAKDEKTWLSQFLTLEFYHSLFGMFDLNTQSVVIRSPLQVALDHIELLKNKPTANNLALNSYYAQVMSEINLNELHKVAPFYWCC